jgi:hypothetical protein
MEKERKQSFLAGRGRQTQTQPISDVLALRIENRPALATGSRLWRYSSWKNNLSKKVAAFFCRRRQNLHDPRKRLHSRLQERFNLPPPKVPPGLFVTFVLSHALVSNQPQAPLTGLFREIVL